jgi:hypothetical protein
MLIHGGSTAVNDMTKATKQEPTQTLTESDYQACKKHDKNACLRSDIYTVAFAVPDRVIAAGLVVTGQAEVELLAGSHGEIHHEFDKLLPQVSKQQESYGGAKWSQFHQYYKGDNQ